MGIMATTDQEVVRIILHGVSRGAGPTWQCRARSGRPQAEGRLMPAVLLLIRNMSSVISLALCFYWFFNHLTYVKGFTQHSTSHKRLAHTKQNRRTNLTMYRDHP